MVDYNKIAKNFAESRKDMKWQEIIYLLHFLKNYSIAPDNEKILDIGCGSGRLLEHIHSEGILYSEYVGVDVSDKLLDEAKKNYPRETFVHSNMIDVHQIAGTFTAIFLIASFHHLEQYEERKKVLESLYKKIDAGGYIYMTNWALSSSYNTEKYADSVRENSENKYGSTDYDIYFGEYPRYYHNFALSELEALAEETGFHVVENRVFDGERNILTILQKIVS